MKAKNKHHIRTEHGPKPWDMNFPGDLSISARKIITMKTRQNLGHFVTQQINPYPAQCTLVSPSKRV